jgi:TonB family protein
MGMNKKFILSISLSVLVHILLVLILAGIAINLDPPRNLEQFQEVSFVYEKSKPKHKEQEKAVLKKKAIPKIVEKEPEKEPVPKLKKDPEKKVSLPDVASEKPKEEPPKKLDEKEPEKTEVLPVKEELVVTKSDTPEEKPKEGGLTGNSAIDLNPSSNVQLMGPIVNRSILYSEVPEFPEWAKRKGIETSVRVRFWVRPNGLVYNISVIKKSGYFRLDLLVKNAIAKWEFTSLEEGVTEEEQWGELVVFFVLY